MGLPSILLVLTLFTGINSLFVAKMGNYTYKSDKRYDINYREVSKVSTFSWDGCEDNAYYSLIMRYVRKYRIDMTDVVEEKFLYKKVNYLGQHIKSGITIEQYPKQQKKSEDNFKGISYSKPFECTIFDNHCTYRWSSNCKFVWFYIELYKQPKGFIEGLKGQSEDPKLVLGGEYISKNSATRIKMHMYGNRKKIEVKELPLETNA